MVEIDNILIGDGVFTEHFVCDLAACKGACCIEGEAGAPLLEEEIPILESVYKDVKPYLQPEGVKAIDEYGVSVIDPDGDHVTPLIKGKECAFTTFDDDGTARCGIEQAHRDGKIDFLKPISCHLYPIRTKKLSIGEAMNYDQWSICAPACACGKEMEVKVFRFLKAPLIRKYGEDFYQKLEEADKLLQESGSE